MPDGSITVEYDSVLTSKYEDLIKQMNSSARFLSRGCVEGSCKSTYVFDRPAYQPVTYHTDVPIPTEPPVQTVFDYLE